MGAVLSFSIEFLGPPILSDPSRPSRAEWPPAPSRVYAALLAAAYEHDLGSDVLDAIEGLEGSAPGITAPEAWAVTGHRLAVPTAFRHRGLALMPEPEVCPASPVVWYHWPVRDDKQAELIGETVRRLHHVGRGESLVIGEVGAPGVAPAANWVPAETAAPGCGWFRVPRMGRRASFDRAYARGRCDPDMDAPAPYRRVGAAAAVGPVHGPWGELLVLRLGAAGDIRHSAALADGLRRAVLSRLGDEALPEVHGHGAGGVAHVAWLSLPHVGGERGDGRVIGLAAALPGGISPEASAQVRGALAGLREVAVVGRRWPVAPMGRPLATLRPETWARPATRWASATPIVLEHRVRWADKREVARAVAQAVARAGYPRPVAVEAGSVGAWRGVPHAMAVASRRGGGLPRVHAVVEFAEAVAGPVLAGGERHFGLGLFRPLS